MVSSVDKNTFKSTVCFNLFFDDRNAPNCKNVFFNGKMERYKLTFHPASPAEQCRNCSPWMKGSSKESSASTRKSSPSATPSGMNR